MKKKPESIVDEILRLYVGHPVLKSLSQWLSTAENGERSVGGLHGSASSLLVAALSRRCPSVMPIICLMNDADQAGYLYNDLTQILGEEYVGFFPSSFRQQGSDHRDSANTMLRAEVLESLSHGSLPLVVSYPEAVAEMVPSSRSLQEQIITLRRGQQIEPLSIIDKLLSRGFVRVDYVSSPGEVALRGGILDVFSYAAECPFRLDFFGDEVESIRTFDVDTQLSRERCDEMVIVPDLMPSQGEEQSFLSFLPPESLLVVRSRDFLCEAVSALLEKNDMSEVSFTDAKCFSDELYSKRTLTLKVAEGDSTHYTFHTQPQPLFHKNFDLVCSSLCELKDQGYRLFILSASSKQTERLSSIFEDRGAGIQFTAVERLLHEGFSDSDLGVALYTDHQIFDRFHKYTLRSERIRSVKVALTLKELKSFEVGDYIVHIDHGVGVFGGLVQIPVGNRKQEVIKIIYRNNDVVFVPIHALYKISKYKGQEGEAPRINALGTGAWERMKERTKTKIKDIARDLIRLYSLRAQERGFAFSRDTYMQQELEASFDYEDTPDQTKASAEVKADMERPRPMDRLVCGDVGFGKTEIAIRAAFKACADSKQVAVLVPTTVLALQHFRTFSQRLANFPVRIEYLSRARSAIQTRKITSDLEQGLVDILIGTHKLLGKGVRFKDLGLLIIDEEQKFGVSTKEKLRQLRTNVDTLTLTATPIPRTLQFSLMGARDLSIIQTPPPNRLPIQTILCQPSAQVIEDAITFELRRGGQVFFVAPRISQLPETERLIHRYVPEARVVIAHGQMPPAQLEQIMLDFINQEFDVLLSTSIIENGLDIPNANTILISGAHHFGLSDLHQMRGRVGRSQVKAYCYLLAPPLSVLADDARRRLEALENYSDLGSGLHIAMQDLDIRGAGNLLGAEQSGFIADLGYEAYKKILQEAVQELRINEFPGLFPQEPQKSSDFVVDCLVETDLPMSFSEAYVPISSERMMLYRELDSLETEDQLVRFRQRMQDRFGPIPHEAQELISVPTLRSLGRRFAVERLVLRAGRMRLNFVSNDDNPFYQSHAFDQLIAFATTNAHRCKLEERDGRRSLLISEVNSIAEAVTLLQQASVIIC